MAGYATRPRRLPPRSWSPPCQHRVPPQSSGATAPRSRAPTARGLSHADRELSQIPAVSGLYLKSAVSALWSGGSIPDERVLVHRVRVDADQGARYDRVCGFSFSDRLPPTFPHLLAFPLSLELMARPSSPFALPGFVHVTNSIAQHRPIRVFDVGAGIGRVRPAPRVHLRVRLQQALAAAEQGGLRLRRGRWEASIRGPIKCRSGRLPPPRMCSPADQRLHGEDP